MPIELVSWPRPRYAPTEAQALIFYAAFGDFDFSERLSVTQYRSNGPPQGIDLIAFQRSTHPDYLSSFCQGFVWDELRRGQPDFSSRIEKAPNCVVLRGELSDPPTLDYLRDCVGTVTYLFDRGAIAVYDPQILRWWTYNEWRDDIFSPAEALPHRHVVILVSEEQDGLWFHTRGMRKFARPDISIHGVGAKYRDAIIDLCCRFIDFMAMGGLPDDGEAIRMQSLPSGGVVRHRGDVADPDFNNVHLEVTWPAKRLLSGPV
jgi:hypothetical protein